MEAPPKAPENIVSKSEPYFRCASLRSNHSPSVLNLSHSPSHVPLSPSRWYGPPTQGTLSPASLWASMLAPRTQGRPGFCPWYHHLLGPNMTFLPGSGDYSPRPALSWEQCSQAGDQPSKPGRGEREEEGEGQSQGPAHWQDMGILKASGSLRPSCLSD